MREMRLGDRYPWPHGTSDPLDTYVTRAFIRVHAGCTVTVFVDGRITYHLPDCDFPYTHKVILVHREALRVWWSTPNWVLVAIGEPPTGVKTKIVRKVLGRLQYLTRSLWDTIITVGSFDKKQRR